MALGNGALATLAFMASVMVATPARAQPRDNDFAVDLFQGPVLAPSRVVSMGGAYTGYAEGIGGLAMNAAATAARHTHSTRWLELDVDASLSFPLVVFDNDDFDNSGTRDADYTQYLYLAGGGLLQAGALGVGALADLQRYAVAFPPNEEPTAVVVGRYHLLAGYHFFAGQLALGAGLRGLSLGVSAPGHELSAELATFGVAPELGLLVRPDWSPVRVGVAYRHAASSDVTLESRAVRGADGIERAGGLIVPREVTLPWELAVGVALQVGPRPLNPRYLDAREHATELEAAFARRTRERAAERHRLSLAVPSGPERARLLVELERESIGLEARQERELERAREHLEGERRAILGNWPRDYLLVTLDLLVTGAVETGQSLEQFLGQGEREGPAEEPGASGPMLGAAPCRVVASGAAVNFSPRVGVEIEPAPGLVHTRFGSYYEPNRFAYEPAECEGRVGRQHFTFGADVRLGTTSYWGLVNEVTYKLQLAGDLAPRYQSLGLGLGVWY